LTHNSLSSKFNSPKSKFLSIKERETIMRKYKQFSVSLVLWLFFIGCSVSVSHAQSPMRTIDNPQGGKIVYGVVDGATSSAAAMSTVLRSVHNSCGEKPQVGKVFRVRGTNSDAVFFTVVNHPQGDKHVAGLLIAAPSGPNRMEAALVSDEATRFGSTVNPMLNRLFSEWHPGGGGQDSGPATGGRSAPPQPLHRVSNQDGSASLAIPSGWIVRGNGGTTLVIEPHYNAMVNINLVRGATNPSRYQPYGKATGMGAKMVYPSNVDPVKGFPGLIKEFYRVNNQGIDFRVAHIEQVAGPPGQRCVHASGHGLILDAGQAQQNRPEKALWEMEMLMCTTAPNGNGDYTVALTISDIDPRFADKERATVWAIFSSYQVNEAVIMQQAGAIAKPAIDAIHQIGARATARMNAVQRANDAQHADYYARQDANSRNIQGFSNYLLDQTVIQDNNVRGTGTIGHGTVWNSTADALAKAYPNRYEIVNAPNFWKGWDY
jgi:hypothetical protein